MRTISRPNQNRGKVPQKKGNPVNDEITANELRVIDEDGDQAGIMLLESALQLADKRKLDLVLISPNANPPVAKIMDYGKYRYDQQKREKETKKKQHVIQVKEIRLSTVIDKHDIEVKAKTAARFLKEGDKVKVSLRFKGRERGRTDRGFEVMERFAEMTAEVGTPEKRAAFEGRSLIMIIAPNQISSKPVKKTGAAPEKSEGEKETATEKKPTTDVKPKAEIKPEADKETTGGSDGKE